jgi:biopolymer transport protein ExbD
MHHTRRSSMKFQTHKTPEPEINLIPFIDVLLVILIFLMLTTSFSKNAQLNINLPKAQTPNSPTKGQNILIQITSSGQFFVQGEQLKKGDASKNNEPSPTSDRALNAQELESALLSAAVGIEQPLVIISADAQTPHQFVIQALSVAQKNQLNNIAFATDSPPKMEAPQR